MYARLGALLSALALAAPTAAFAEELDTEEFSVQLPEGAKRTENDIENVGRLIMYVADNGDTGVAFGWIDYAMELDPQKALEGVRDGILGEGELSKDETAIISVGGKKWPGRRFHGTKGDLDVRATIWLVGNRLYQLLAMSPAGKDSPIAYAPMVASFKLKPAAK